MMPTVDPSPPNPQMSSLAGLRALVVGLGRFGGGVGVTRWLVSQGALVTVTDQAAAGSLAESLKEITDLPVTLCLGGHDGCDLGQTDLVILNPAVLKGKSDLFREILHRNISWTTEMNLFCERCPAPVVGVTGSFGKSTTSAMLAHVLGKCPQAGETRFTGVHLGGNIGRSLLGDLPEIRPTDVVVLEMSNAQLEDIDRIEWGPAVAVLTNLFPHHLDRYENFEGYVRAKLNLVRAGGKQCPVVVGEMDPLARRLLEEAVGGALSRLKAIQETGAPIELLVAGEHNQANAACAMTVCRVLGLPEGQVRESLKSFSGLPHRLELVAQIGGVDYINDSKSTAPAATIIAMNALREKHGKLIAIVGGQKKDVPLGGCATSLALNCREVICYGESRDAFSEAIKSATAPASPTIRVVPGLEAAVAAAAESARAGDTVLFSPGAPSFDQYVNFTERGRHFAALVATPKTTHLVDSPRNRH